MDAPSRKALSIIRRCLTAKRYIVLPHFVHRMDERGFFWADVLALLDQPGKVRSDGRDRFNRPKWIIGGTAPDGVELDIVCVLDEDDRSRVTVFITIY